MHREREPQRRLAAKCPHYRRRRCRNQVVLFLLLSTRRNRATTTTHIKCFSWNVRVGCVSFRVRFAVYCLAYIYVCIVCCVHVFIYRSACMLCTELHMYMRLFRAVSCKHATIQNQEIEPATTTTCRASYTYDALLHEHAAPICEHYVKTMCHDVLVFKVRVFWVSLGAKEKSCRRAVKKTACTFMHPICTCIKMQRSTHENTHAVYT